MDNQRDKQGQYVPAEGEYPRVELDGVQEHMSCNKRLEEIRELVSMGVYSSGVERNFNVLLDEIERLLTALHTHQSYDKTVTELQEEVGRLEKARDNWKRRAEHWDQKYDADVSQLREERDQQFIKIAMQEEVLHWYAKQDIKCEPRHCDGGKRARWVLGIGEEHGSMD